MFGGVFADVFGDLHRAEVRAAHAAEVGGFGAFLGESRSEAETAAQISPRNACRNFVVEFAGGLGVDAEVELILPAEFEAGFDGDHITGFLRLRCLEIGCDIASLVQDFVGGSHGNEFDEFADAELMLADDLNADDIAFDIEIKHDQTGPEWFGASHFPIANPDVSSRGLGVDFDDRRFGDRDDEPGKVSSSIR